LKVFIKENNTFFSRLGISISSKHVNAVNRNKFKRRTREAVRSLPDNKHFDILVVGNKDSSNLKPAEILKVLKSHPLL
jgi:ribonuclease P protein component